jgi:hypothetical protein
MGNGDRFPGLNMRYIALWRSGGGIGGWCRIKAATCGFNALLLLAFISEVVLLLERASFIGFS